MGAGTVKHKCRTFAYDEQMYTWACTECGAIQPDDDERDEDEYEVADCPHCNGTGLDMTGLEECEYCDGMGYKWWL